MAGSSIGSAAVVGAGLVGSAWAIVFARAGVTVRAFDASEDIRRTTVVRIRASLEDMAKAGLVDGVDAICSRVTVVDDLRAAVSEVDYVQESVFERVEEKRAVSEAVGALIRDDAVVGSSSAGIPASAFTEHAPRRERFLIAHPVNPPHLVPLVELVPAPWTDPAIVLWLRAAMRRSARPRSSSIGRSRGSSSIACRACFSRKPGRCSTRVTRAQPTSTSPCPKGWACAGHSWGRSRRST